MSQLKKPGASCLVLDDGASCLGTSFNRGEFSRGKLPLV